MIWQEIPNDKAKWALVSRLKRKQEINAGSSLHVAEVHVEDDDGTLYRFHRAIDDYTPIAVDDRIEKWLPVEKTAFIPDTPERF